MKPAAFVADGRSLEKTMGELRALNAKVFAVAGVEKQLEDAGIRCQVLANPLGISRLLEFGHKEIHVFGLDLCNVKDGHRICFENVVYFTTEEQAQYANSFVMTCLSLADKGATIIPHGDGLTHAILRSVLRSKSERVLTAVYDLQVSPPTYEVFTFLAEAERHRAANGYDSIDLVFAPGPMHGFRDDWLPPSPAERAAMLHRICVAGARLLPSVRNVHVMKQRAHLQGEFFPTDWTNDRPRFLYGPSFQKNGHACLEATQAARDEIARRYHQPYATITLREAEYWPNRNSTRDAWQCAATFLQNEGVPPVIIPDTHGQGLDGFENFTPAAWDIDLRLALYEGATLNLGVANGPMALCMFGKKWPPYLIFQKPDESSATPEAFMRSNGIAHGEPWTPNGWTVWEDDTPDNVMRELRKWFDSKATEVRMA